MSGLASKRILVVDDENLIAMLAEDMLRELGAVPVGPASTVQEAIEFIERTQFDAAILDVNLNGATSEELARRLRQEGVPFIVVTGYGRVDWHGLDVPVLPKPYDRTALGDALHRVLSRPTG